VHQNILENLWDEEYGVENHRQLWLDFSTALGLDEQAVENSEVLPTTQVLLDTYSTITDQANFQEGLAVMYAYEAQVPKVAMEKIRGLKEFYSIDSDQAVKFFEVHSTMDEEHSAR